MEVEYSQEDAPLTNEDAIRCQKCIARRLGKPYASRRLKLFQKCLNKRDKGVLTSCLDTVSQRRLDRVQGKMEARLGSKCTDELVQALQASGGFPGSCSTAETVGALATCQMDEHDAEIDRLVNIIP